MYLDRILGGGASAEIWEGRYGQSPSCLDQHFHLRPQSLVPDSSTQILKTDISVFANAI